MTTLTRDANDPGHNTEAEERAVDRWHAEYSRHARALAVVAQRMLGILDAVAQRDASPRTLDQLCAEAGTHLDALEFAGRGPQRYPTEEER